MCERVLLGPLDVKDLPPDSTTNGEETFVEWSLRGGLNTGADDLCAEKALLLLQQAGTKAEVEAVQAPAADRAVAEN